MLDLSNFKLWLLESQTYSDRTVGNIVCRLKRADSILSWSDEPTYQYLLEKEKDFISLSPAVKSQIRKAISLFTDYTTSKNIQSNYKKKSPSKMRVLSLFANIGVAEAYLEKIGFDVVVANELIERRAALYSKIYPKTNMICGDITNEDIFESIVKASIKAEVDVVMATPPCQGMSTAGQQREDDFRNTLICPVIDIVKLISPKYVFIENVPLFLNTYIEIENNKILIKDYLEQSLGNEYIINKYVIDTKDYSVPQSRERAIILLTKKGNKEWTLPDKDKKMVTLRDAIGHLPPLDPFVKDVDEKELLSMFPHYYERVGQAAKISSWHKPPHHIKRQVVVMQHTPTGCTAFDNAVYYPIKEDGTAVRGYHNTYKRQNWDTTAYTVTMDNRKISSQNNVHPGRLEYVNEKGEEIYSDARTLTLYEIMIVSSLPPDWNIPKNTQEAFLRRIIGEGIPPLFVKKVFEKLKEVSKYE